MSFVSPLVDEIGEYALSGMSLYKVLLNYKCCANELTDGGVTNCKTGITDNVSSFRNFETFRLHMWKKHGIDVSIRCAEVLAAKKDQKIAESMGALSVTAKKTTKTVTSFAPKKAPKKASEAINYDYYWSDGTPCTKADYDEAMMQMYAEDEEEAEEA